MKKMELALSLACGVILGLALFVVAVPPCAHAADVDRYPTYRSKAACPDRYGFRGGIKTCLTLNWRKQDDGDGVYLEAIAGRTRDGCDMLEDSGGKYVNASFSYVDPSSYATDYYYAPPYGLHCGFTLDTENPGSDHGSMQVNARMTVRIDQDQDRTLFAAIKIKPSGKSRVVYAFTRDAARVAR